MCKTVYSTDIQNVNEKQCRFCVGDYLGYENVGLATIFLLSLAGPSDYFYPPRIFCNASSFLITELDLTDPDEVELHRKIKLLKVKLKKCSTTYGSIPEFWLHIRSSGVIMRYCTNFSEYWGPPFKILIC